MSISRITPLLYVADVARSLGFYVDLLGFQVIGEFDEGGAALWRQLRSGEAYLMLNAYPDGKVMTTSLPDDFGSVLYLNTESVHDLILHLRAAGLDVADPEPQEYGVDQIWVRDPDGYQLCFTSPFEPGRRGV